MDGRDLHVGDFGWGILPAAAPLGISTLTIAGIAMAFAARTPAAWRVVHRRRRILARRMARGDQPLRHPSAARGLLRAEQPDRALHSRRPSVRRARVRGQGGRLRRAGITIDGTDPEAVAAAFAWSAERARAGRGPTLVELVAMRMCGHAHHDDMLYLGKDPQPSWSYPALSEQGYADPMPTPSGRRGTPSRGTPPPRRGGHDRGGGPRRCSARRSRWWRRRPAGHRSAVARRQRVGVGVLAGEAPRRHVEVLEKRDAATSPTALPPSIRVPRGSARADVPGRGDAGRRAMPCAPTRASSSTAKDVGGKYGNAFLLLRPLLKEFGDRILNSPLAEGGVLGRLHRSRPRGPAPHRRDAVQRLRGQRVQPARQQRGQDPLPLGRLRAHGGAHALGRAAPRRPRTTARTPSPGSTARRA
jgi:hypothetical protein